MYFNVDSDKDPEDPKGALEGEMEFAEARETV